MYWVLNLILNVILKVLNLIFKVILNILNLILKVILKVCMMFEVNGNEIWRLLLKLKKKSVR